MNIIAIIIALLTPDPEPTPVLECGAPLCVYEPPAGPPWTAACDPGCGPWVPGINNTCGGWACEPIGAASQCRWHCKT